MCLSKIFLSFPLMVTRDIIITSSNIHNPDIFPGSYFVEFELKGKEAHSQPPPRGENPAPCTRH